MKGAILEKGETGYTYLKKLFLSIRHAQKDFNWLITDCQCCTQSKAFYQRIFQYDRYGWLSGEELTRMVETEDFQWIWAVLSGFPRHISLDQVLEYDLPYADQSCIHPAPPGPGGNRSLGQFLHPCHKPESQDRVGFHGWFSP